MRVPPLTYALLIGTRDELRRTWMLRRKAAVGCSRVQLAVSATHKQTRRRTTKKGVWADTGVHANTHTHTHYNKHTQQTTKCYLQSRRSHTSQSLIISCYFPRHGFRSTVAPAHSEGVCVSFVWRCFLAFLFVCLDWFLVLSHLDSLMF